jgi:signal transduction histidine kinase
MMKSFLTPHRINIILLALLVLLGGASFAYNNHLLHNLLKKERSRVALWAQAMKAAGNTTRQKQAAKLYLAAKTLRRDSTISDSLLQSVRAAATLLSSNNFAIQQIILNDQFKIPAIIADQNGTILATSHLSGKVNRDMLNKMAGWHLPVQIHFGSKENQRTQYVYYGESATIRYLRWFPYIQFSLLALLLGLGFVSYRTIHRSEQSNILVGMTREAAHQLGTPLSSMYGWISLLRTEHPAEPFIERVASELEKDVKRLQGVAERFNKIGSKPALQVHKLTPHIEAVMNYMSRRLPRLGRKVAIKCSIEANVQAKINPELFEWALENVLKNSMNAINGNLEGAFISVTAKQVEKQILVDIQDSGHGIEKKHYKEIFKPGYSTKKRGWGLGLSLTKRIIEDYHNGEVFVAHSKPGKGTTIRILLRHAGSTEEKQNR